MIYKFTLELKGSVNLVVVIYIYSLKPESSVAQKANGKKNGKGIRHVRHTPNIRRRIKVEDSHRMTSLEWSKTRSRTQVRRSNDIVKHEDSKSCTGPRGLICARGTLNPPSRKWIRADQTDITGSAWSAFRTRTPRCSMPSHCTISTWHLHRKAICLRGLGRRRCVLYVSDIMRWGILRNELFYYNILIDV